MTQAKYILAHWITSVVFHDDGPATYAVHKKDTAPDLVTDYIPDEETAILIAAAPKLLEVLQHVMHWWHSTAHTCDDEMPADLFDDAHAAIAEAQPPDRTA